MLQGFAGQASRSKPVIWLRLRNRSLYKTLAFWPGGCCTTGVEGL